MLEPAYNCDQIKYNTVQVPVQMQFADDPEFLARLMSVSQQSKSNQENGLDSDESESDLNCSDVINQSDIEQTEEKDNPGGTGPKDKSTSDYVT